MSYSVFLCVIAVLILFLQTTQALVRQQITSYQTLSLILNAQATPKDVQKIQQQVQDDFRLKSLPKATFDDALGAIKQNFDLQFINTENIAPLFYGVIQFQVKDNYLLQLDSIINRLSVYEEVEEVFYFPDQLQQAMMFGTKINQLSLAILIGICIVYMMFSWYGTSALLSVHYESLSLKILFGANSSMIYLPFLKEVVIIKSLALVIPLGLTSFLSQKIPFWLEGLIIKFPNFLILGDIEYDPFFFILSLELFGVLLTFLIIHLHVSKLI